MTFGARIRSFFDAIGDVLHGVFALAPAAT
jgi:hypothetical protein